MVLGPSYKISSLCNSFPNSSDILLVGRLCTGASGGKPLCQEPESLSMEDTVIS